MIEIRFYNDRPPVTVYLNQTVQLNDRGLKLYATGNNVPRRSHPDWSARRGIIERLTRDRSRAYVRWGGNKFRSDAIPVMCLDVVE